MSTAGSSYRYFCSTYAGVDSCMTLDCHLRLSEEGRPPFAVVITLPASIVSISGQCPQAFTESEEADSAS